MVADLRLTDKEYLLCLTIFYFSYAFFEVRPLPAGVHQVLSVFLQAPSNVFLKRLRPSLWLSSLMILWGIIMVSLVTFSHRARCR